MPRQESHTGKTQIGQGKHGAFVMVSLGRNGQGRVMRLNMD